MAGNFGKFRDRTPIICAAGKSTDSGGNSVASALKEYSLEDQITAIKHDAKIWTDDRFKSPLELAPIQNPAFQGTNTQIRDLLNPPVRTRYQTLIDDLKETTYDSYWNKQDGKVRDGTPGLPPGMIPTDVTVGIPSIKDIAVKELVNPSKPPYEVLRDSQVGHEMYRKTHNDYNPSEQINRGYIAPPFIRDKCFGIQTKYDPRGIWVRCACDWHKKEPIVHASQIQADYLDRVRPEIGKSLTPNRNIECVPKGHIFGDPSKRVLFGVEELMKDPCCEPCIFKRDFYKWISSLNKLRLKMKERKNKGFDFDYFFKRALYCDKDKTGFLPIHIFYELCSCHDLTFSKENIESLLKCFNIIIEDKINYEKFIEIINSDSAPIELKPFNDIPKEGLHYVTTSQAASCDYLIINNSDMLAAGIPSRRTDLAQPIVPAGACRADLDNLGEETSVNALINPSIYTTYGLNYRDFYMPRSADLMRKLFEKVGYHFPGDTFENIWKEGQELDQTGFVCVDTFKSLLKKHFPYPKLSVDEADCDKMP